MRNSKRFHCGRAAQSGVYSASLAKRGFTGVLDVLEAPTDSATIARVAAAVKTLTAKFPVYAEGKG